MPLSFLTICYRFAQKKALKRCFFFRFSNKKSRIDDQQGGGVLVGHRLRTPPPNTLYKHMFALLCFHRISISETHK